MWNKSTIKWKLERGENQIVIVHDPMPYYKEFQKENREVGKDTIKEIVLANFPTTEAKLSIKCEVGII